MQLSIESEREDDGRWLAEVPQLPGVLAIGWRVKRQSGSHKTLSRNGWPDVVFAFHDSEEIGPKMLPGSRSGPG